MEMLKNGIFIMIMGMFTVYAFLIILMYAMKFSGKVIGILNKYFPEKITEQKSLPKKDDFAEIAIAVALASKRRNQ